VGKKKSFKHWSEKKDGKNSASFHQGLLLSRGERGNIENFLNVMNLPRPPLTAARGWTNGKNTSEKMKQ